MADGRDVLDTSFTSSGDTPGAALFSCSSRSESDDCVPSIWLDNTGVRRRGISGRVANDYRSLSIERSQASG